MEEQHLYQQIKASNQAAFDQLFHLHYEKLVRIAYKNTQDQSTAEDIVQSVFIDCWTKRAQLTIQQSIIAYLTRMVHNRCIDHFRKLKSRTTTQQKYLDTLPALAITSPEEVLLNQENLAAIYTHIEALPPKCKIVFKMSRFEEMTYADIAEQLDISKKTVEYHVATALRLLRKGIFSLTLVFFQ